MRLISLASIFLLQNSKFRVLSTLRGCSTFSGKFPIDDGAGQWPVGVGRGKRAPGYSGAHDLGGVDLNEAIDLSKKPEDYKNWEREMHAMLVLLVGKKYLTVDEMRRGIEQLHPEHYKTWGYYEKWAGGVTQILLETGVIAEVELDKALFGEEDDSEGIPEFQVGDIVKVKEENILARHRKAHLRTPGYIFGVYGVVESYCGLFNDPEFLAFRGKDKKQHLYRVTIKMRDVWPHYEGKETDTVEAEVSQNWLEPAATAKSLQKSPSVPHNMVEIRALNAKISHNQHHHHHEHEHEHLSRDQTEFQAIQLEGEETPGARLVHALRTLLKEKKILNALEIREAVEKIDSIGNQLEGQRIVAKAWTDPEFKRRLLTDASSACAELGIVATNSTTHTVLTALENTDKVHNLIVCTLCSCYPLSILGMSPPWYKSRAYRSKAVRIPRKMLAEDFGLELPNEVSIKVHDSTADLRYIVIPKRPEGTEGWSEDQLAKLVSRDMLIGVAVPKVK